MLPRIVQLEKNLFVAAFNLMKLLPAKCIITEAMQRGDINDNYTIVDTSSGTFALGIGIICCELGLKFKIFGDKAIDRSLLKRLEELGGKVHIVRKCANAGAYQIERLNALHTFISAEKLSFWTRQYDNLENSKSYHIVGEQLLSVLGKGLNLVGTVGSGGSTCGVITGIRDKDPNAQLIGVDTFNSILFGMENGRRDLRGLGNTIMPKNLDHTLFDEVHWVSANDANYHTRLLHAKHALFLGPTSGAAYQVAKYLASKNPEQKYVFIAPDDGYRYLKTVFNDTWLRKQEYYSLNITAEPKETTSPKTASQPWSFIRWNRRSINDYK